MCMSCIIIALTTRMMQAAAWSAERVKGMLGRPQGAERLPRWADEGAEANVSITNPLLRPLDEGSESDEGGPASTRICSMLSSQLLETLCDVSSLWRRCRRGEAAAQHL